MGRPTKYNEKLSLEILKLYSEGNSIRNIVKGKSMPSRQTILAWRYAYPEFDKAYKVALKAHTEAVADEIKEIVLSCDDKTAKSAKVKADYLSWLISRLNRQAFGDKLEVNHNHTIDIAPALALAVKRMEAIGVGTLAPELIEADSDTL